MTEREPIVLIAADFTDGRLSRLKGCTLVSSHVNLIKAAPEDENNQSDSRNLLKIALATADDFPELQVGLLDCVAHPDTAEALSVYVSKYGIQCAALILTEWSVRHFSCRPQALIPRIRDGMTLRSSQRLYGPLGRRSRRFTRLGFRGSMRGSWDTPPGCPSWSGSARPSLPELGALENASPP